jgi:O-antigen/teichoic acid export membrane protein
MRFPAVARLLSTSGLVMIGRLAGAGFGFLTQVVLARVLPADELGLFFLATSIAAVVGSAAALGYPNMVPLLFARYQERSRPELVSAFASYTRREAAYVSGLVTVLVIVAVVAFGWATGAGLAIAAAAFAIPATAVMRVNGALANAARRFALSFFPELFFRPLGFLVLVLLMMAAGLPLSAVTLGLAVSAIAVGAAAAQAWGLRSHLPRKAPPQSPVRLIRHWRATARPLIIVGVFSTLFADLSLAVAGLFLGKSDLAPFGICIKLAFLVGFVVQLAHQIATPELAASHARRESAAPRILGHANLLAVVVTLAAVVVCVAFGEHVLGLFGPGYGDAKPVLILVVASQFVRACFGPNVQLLTLMRLQKPMAMVFALSVVMLVGANLLLVPGFGVVGAAAAVALTTVFWTAALAVVLHRGAGLRTDVLFAR